MIFKNIFSVYLLSATRFIKFYMSIEGTELSQQATPIYMGPSGPVVASPAAGIVGTPQPPLFPIGQPPPPYGTPLAQLGPGNILPIPNGTAPLYLEKLPEPEPEPIPIALAEPEVEADLAPPPALDLPPKWKWARDKRGRVYYFHVKERVSQWLPPPPDHIAVQPDSSTTSESSDESSSSNEDEEDVDEQFDQQAEGMDVDPSETAVVVIQPEVKKRRDGLVQERIISVSSNNIVENYFQTKFFYCYICWKIKYNVIVVQCAAAQRGRSR